MFKIIIFFILCAFQVQAEDHFSSPLEQQKVLGCLARYNNFMTNHRFFKQIDFNSVCRCEQVRTADLLNHYHELLTGLRYHVLILAKSEDANCRIAFKDCFKLSFEKVFDSTLNAEDVCRRIDGLIDEEFKTPFSNNDLKNALMNFIPRFQAPYMEWGGLFCNKFLPMAKLHEKCTLKGSGISSGEAEGSMNGPPVKEEIPPEELLH